MEEGKGSRNIDKAASILNYILANMVDMKDEMDDERMWSSCSSLQRGSLNSTTLMLRS